MLSHSVDANLILGVFIVIHCICVYCIVACSQGYFRCVAGGSCLSSYRRCNGRCDCPYCTDELNCYIPPSHPNITTPWYHVSTTYRPYTTTRRPWLTSTYQSLFNYSKLTTVVCRWFTMLSVYHEVNLMRQEVKVIWQKASSSSQSQFVARSSPLA